MKKCSMEEIYPKNYTGKCMVYFNMSHHYRRIYSAKPRVDTNLRRPQSQMCCTSPDVFNFVRRNCMKQTVIMTPRHRICQKQLEEDGKQFQPKILDTKTESRLKQLTVYEPPQKIKLQPIEVKDVNKSHSDETDKQKEDDNVSIMETPSKSESVMRLSEEKYNYINVEQKHEAEDIVEEEPYMKSHETNVKLEPSAYRPVDKSSIKFLKDITDDILQKGVYSNKNLEKLFEYHINKNKHSLPKELMLKEIARLKAELDMPFEEIEAIRKETVELAPDDEEALRALDSLLLPQDIREEVAASLGLLRLQPPPALPSPKDSFTGSLELEGSGAEEEENESSGTEGSLGGPDIPGGGAESPTSPAGPQEAEGAEAGGKKEEEGGGGSVDDDFSGNVEMSQKENTNEKDRTSSSKYLDIIEEKTEKSLTPEIEQLERSGRESSLEEEVSEKRSEERINDKDEHREKEEEDEDEEVDSSSEMSSIHTEST